MILSNFGFGSGGGGASGYISGAGTAPKMPKFTAEKTIADSQVSDNGTTVFIGASATSEKALFELNSTTQGVLLPRLTTTQINAITIGATTNSLMLYSTTANRFRYYNHASVDANKWETLATLNDIPAAATTIYSGDGSLSGNRTVTMGANTLLFSGNQTTFKGAGSTSRTSSLLVQNAADAELFRVRNDGAVISQQGYWQGTNKILYINPNGTNASVFVGQTSGNNTLTGGSNSGVGRNSLLALTSGYENVATSGYENVAIGDGAARKITSGFYNIAIGVNALSELLTGFGNVAIGQNASQNSGNVNQTVAIGLNAMRGNTQGNCVGIGVNSLQINSGDSNVGVGANSLRDNTTGRANVSIGTDVLYVNTIGSSNIGIGNSVLVSNNTGSNNTAIGEGTLALNVSGSSNVAIGYYALLNNTEGQSVAVGRGAGQMLSTGYGITAIGYAAGITCTTGSLNTIVGNSADVTVGSNAGNSVLGAFAKADGNFNVVLGYNASAPTGNNQFVVGNATQTVGAITTEVITPDTSWTIWINGSQYKVALKTK